MYFRPRFNVVLLINRKLLFFPLILWDCKSNIWTGPDNKYWRKKFLIVADYFCSCLSRSNKLITVKYDVLMTWGFKVIFWTLLSFINLLVVFPFSSHWSRNQSISDLTVLFEKFLQWFKFVAKLNIDLPWPVLCTQNFPYEHISQRLSLEFRYFFPQLDIAKTTNLN